jgi:hypothetical protein
MFSSVLLQGSKISTAMLLVMLHHARPCLTLNPIREICMQFLSKYCSICSTPFLLTLLRILLKMVLDAFYFTYYTCLYIQIHVLQQNIHTICVSRVETNFGTSTELWHSLEQLQPIRGNQRTVIYDIFFFPSQK